MFLLLADDHRSQYETGFASHQGPKIKRSVPVLDLKSGMSRGQNEIALR